MDIILYLPLCGFREAASCWGYHGQGGGGLFKARKIFLWGALLEELLAVRCPPPPLQEPLKRGFILIPNKMIES
jgi:hypothetical protein